MIMWIHTITIYTNTIKIIIYTIIIVYLLIFIVKLKIVIIHFLFKNISLAIGSPHNLLSVIYKALFFRIYLLDSIHYIVYLCIIDSAIK